MTTTPSRKPRAAKTKPRAAIRWDRTAPEPCQAAQLAFALMRRAKVTSWRQLVDRMREQPDLAASVWLTEEQQAIVDRWLHLVPYLSADRTVTVTVIACSGCGGYGLHDKRPVPSACYFTVGCSGKLVRAAITETSAAKAAKVEDEPVGTETGPQITVTPDVTPEVALAVAETAAESQREQPPPPAVVRAVTSSFLAVDFELGTASKASPVQIGVALVRDGAIVRTETHFVCPPEPVEEFGPWQQENLPFGPEVQFDGLPWPEVLRLLTDLATVEQDGATRMLPIVAHNAAEVERHVIGQTSAAAGIALPPFLYACTREVATRVDPGAGRYGLDVLAARYGIELDAHHDAGADAVATAQLALRLLGVEGGREAFRASVERICALGPAA